MFLIPIRNWAVRSVSELGAILLFFWRVLQTWRREGIFVTQVIDQIYAVGVRSLSTTLISGIFVGAIMAVQINLQLVGFGAQGFLGGLATSVTIRDVGPVVIAFMLSGKVGAYTSAELGTMRVTEQMDAVRCLGANPLQCIILPRMVAVVISSALLLIIGLMVGILGGILISSLQLGMNAANYVQNIPQIVSGWSVGIGLVKSFILGLIIAVICCYHGYHAEGGAVGVGETVKKTAVQTLVCIIVADFVITTASGFLYSLLHLGEI